MKQMKNKGVMRLEHWKLIALYLLIYDIVTINLSYFIGLWLRFDLQYSKIPSEYLMAFIKFAPFYTVFSIIVFYMMHMYNSLWRFASFNELTSIMMATVVTGTAHVVGITLFVRRMPIAYYVFGICAQFIFTTGIRFGYRFVNLERAKREKTEKSAHVKHHVMVIGAGAAGMTVLRELHNSRELTSRACCVIDDNPNKWNRFIEGTPIVGGRDTILENVEKYDIDTIMLTMPSASAKDKRDILNICKETNCELKSLPGIYQLANGEVLLSKMKSVAIEDLLGRDQIKVDMAEIFNQLKGKTILVTGAAGFIGSNLVKRLFNDVENIKVIGIDSITDYYDVNIKYERLKEIEALDKDWTFVHDSIANKEIIEKIFSDNQISVVVNLAAQAGVRYSITNPDAYIQSNLIGFYNILEACRHYEVEHLVYASSSSVYGSNKKVPYSTDDKVDNPVSLYAATKKSNELMAHAYSKLYNIPSTGLRFFTVYGPAGRPDMAYFGFTNKLVKGDTIKIFNYGNCKRDFTYVDDIVEGIVRVMQHAPEKQNGEDGLPIPPYKVYNIGNSHPENLLEFVSILQEELIRAGVLPEDYDFDAHKELVAMQPGDVPVTYADTTPLEEDFGYKPDTSLRYGLRAFAEWYKGYYQM